MVKWKTLKAALAVGAITLGLSASDVEAKAKSVSKSKVENGRRRKAKKRRRQGKPRARRQQTESVRWQGYTGITGLGLAQSRRFRVWNEFGIFASKSITTIANTLGLGYRLSRNVEAELGVGVMSVRSAELAFDIEGEPTTSTSLTNPTIGINGLFEDDELRIKVGIQLSLPVIRSKVDLGGARTLVAASSVLVARGLQDPFAYAPNSWGISVPFRIEEDFGGWLTSGVSLGVGGLFHAHELDVGDYLYLHAAPGFGFLLSRNVVLGLNLPFTTLLRLDGGSETPTDTDIDFQSLGLQANTDTLQTAFEPYLAANLSKALFSIRAILPVRGPSRPFYRGGGNWGLFVNIGAHF